jgi:hypothetical protein
MKAILLATIIAAFKAYVGGGAFARIHGFVVQMTSRSDIAGRDKMAAVLDMAQQEGMTLGETLIRAVVEVILLRFQPEQ